MPASAEGISRYLTFLAGCGAKVGTMSRRLSGIRFAHRMRDLPDPTAAARVITVWEGIRRTHGAPPEQSARSCPRTALLSLGQPAGSIGQDLVGGVASVVNRESPRRAPPRVAPRHHPATADGT